MRNKNLHFWKYPVTCGRCLKFQVFSKYTNLNVRLRSTGDGLEENPVHTRKSTCCFDWSVNHLSHETNTVDLAVFWGPVHTYPDIFQNGGFFLRFRKNPRPHVAFSSLFCLPTTFGAIVNSKTFVFLCPHGSRKYPVWRQYYIKHTPSSLIIVYRLVVPSRSSSCSPMLSKAHLMSPDHPGEEGGEEGGGGRRTPILDLTGMIVVTFRGRNYGFGNSKGGSGR